MQGICKVSFNENSAMKINPTHKPGGGLVVELGPKEMQLAIAESRQLAFKIEKILVPVDFSECANKALQYAVPFAKQFDASLVLLYVVEPYIPIPEMVTIDCDLIATQMREGGQEQLSKLRKTLGDDVKARTELRSGRPEFEIIQAAKDLDVDLIILSTHGRTGFAHVLLGSTTERVVRHAGCPVLVVRESEHEFIGASATEKTAQSIRSATTKSTRPYMP